MIKIVKRFSYNRNFVHLELSALASWLYAYIKLCYFKFRLLNRLSSFLQILFTWAFCWKGIYSLFEWLRANEQDGRRAHIW